MSLPPKSGLYDPQFEHDNCGIGLVARINGEPTHDIVQNGVDILINLEHRGASGSDPLTGDGAGILTQIPDRFFREECGLLGIELPAKGEYGAGLVFLPQEVKERERCRQILEDKIAGTGQRLLGWREVPVDANAPGPQAQASAPRVEQVFIGSTCENSLIFERKLFVIRKWAERTIRESHLAERGLFYIPSLSSNTIVYKGLLLPDQLSKFYLDLRDERFVSALAMVHQRFSTNTFPTWELAQPFRVLCHNGEINTVKGNQAWMAAREQLFSGEIFGEDIRQIIPTIAPGLSDSACLDTVAELLVQAGRSLPHVMMMLVPEAWQNDENMAHHKRDFYKYHATLMEPWDGPAALAFTNGKQVGGVLDRNGLRPARYTITKDGRIVLGSEQGVLPIDPSNIEKTGRLEPGKMFLVDLVEGRMIDDEEIKRKVCTQKPYGEWVKENLLSIDLDGSPSAQSQRESEPLLKRQQMFGFTQETLRLLLSSMAVSGQDPIGSMGTDTPLAVLSDKPQLLYNYFKQHFAQVTNPAIDPIREELVMSLNTYIGPEGNLLFELPEQAGRIQLPGPVLTNEQLAKLRQGINKAHREPKTIDITYGATDGTHGFKDTLTEICRQASAAIADGHGIIVLSDRRANKQRAPIPALLATSAVHHHLMRNGTRMKVGIVVETGEAREVQHFCLLAGYGASAVNPYLAFESITEMVESGHYDGLDDVSSAHQRFINAINKGLKKVMSKMGISTLQSYQGAQQFEALGLSDEVVSRYFTGTVSRIKGIGLDVIAEESRRRHEAAYPRTIAEKPHLEVGGEFHFRSQGERHLWSPSIIATMQKAVRHEDVNSYKEYARLINEQSGGPITLRSLLDFDPAESIPLDEVESASAIVKRFATGAMSYGSISAEAHENLAIAMNRIGGKSNTGEGGEEARRFSEDDNGDLRRSAIKQVASGRFGVTTHYLVNADEIQIKVAQGAKPGEGGQLPGHKVNEIIAKTRHSTPGVTLISPPPHHDIYSIEDLAQLIFDLKMANPKARISVKLVAEAGVGTVAAGVAKAHADVILISGHDGGTGASPLTSIKHAGIPWEIGLAETHQVLVKNDLRSRVFLQTDGQMRTGRDVVIAALLGAEEFGFATAPLVASGCIMMRKCHLNTCPVGIATQDPDLRARFSGAPEHVIRFMFYVAEEARELMARLGFRTLNEMIGKTEYLNLKKDVHWKADRLDFSDLLAPADRRDEVGVFKTMEQDHGLAVALDNQLIELAKPALDNADKVDESLVIRSINRTCGAMLGGEVARRYGAEGLPDHTITFRLSGVAGQSFGAFITKGMSLHLSGEGNDYTGKGMSGGIISVRPGEGATFKASENIIVGNTSFYGATSGKAFINGKAGERFCVRNSGATAVVEGVGDHGCEYMTGGRMICIGKTGRNFAAGMSGGFAYVFDENSDFKSRCNMGMVEVEGLDPEDEIFVKETLAEHVLYTKSKKAEQILQDFTASKRLFVKVVPVEYRRVLKERALAAQAKPTELNVIQPQPGVIN
jgi:glutamate synthase domain-containing protein 2/glutamate synthase domain-containing protein 1/glutamate synthase domain-containing protein 3